MLDSRGLTLLEVLISMIVLSIGVLGLAPLLILSIEANNMSDDAMIVSNLAKEQIELYVNSSSLPGLPFSLYEQGLENKYTRHTYIWDNATDTTIAEGLCQILVSITWTDESGANRSTQYLSVMPKG